MKFRMIFESQIRNIERLKSHVTVSFKYRCQSSKKRRMGQDLILHPIPSLLKKQGPPV